jgi:hypothetical protein
MTTLRRVLSHRRDLGLSLVTALLASDHGHLAIDASANPYEVTLTRDALSLLVEQSPCSRPRYRSAMSTAEGDYLQLWGMQGDATTASRGHS